MALLPLVGLILVWAYRNHALRMQSTGAALLAISGICFAYTALRPLGSMATGIFRRGSRFCGCCFSWGSRRIPSPRRWSALAGASAGCVAAGLLVVQGMAIARIGREIAPVLNSAPAEPGSIGLIISNAKELPAALAFDPYFWSGCHYFRRSTPFWRTPHGWISPSPCSGPPNRTGGAIRILMPLASSSSPI